MKKQPNNHYGNDHEGYEEELKRTEHDRKMAKLINSLALGEPKIIDPKLAQRVTGVYGGES